MKAAMRLATALTPSVFMYALLGGAALAAPAAPPAPAVPAPLAAPPVRRGAPAVSLPRGASSPFDGDDPVALGAALRQVAQSYKLSSGGAASLKAGDVAGARAAFRQALALEPHNPDALYGLARCAGAAGDAAGELGYYRRAVYRQARSTLDRDASGFLETHVPRLVEFALALDRAGQAGEAVSVYDHAAGLLNYRDADLTGGPSQAVLLPEIGGGPGQVPYSPQMLQAMAHLALGVDTNDLNEWVNECRAAAKLAPDSAAVQYYLGRSLLSRDPAASRAALEKAIRLGDDGTAREAGVYLKMLR